MSKSLSSFKDHDRLTVAQQRLRTCNKGVDKDKHGVSGLGYWAAFDYLNKKKELR